GSQGARPKFVAQLSPDGGQLRGHRVPWEPGWRPVLIKRRAFGDPKGMVEAEAAYARMARAAGVEMTGVRIMRAANSEPFFVTDRFDRIGGRRLHMQTVAALLDVDFREATLDYAELLKITRVMTRDQRAVEQMFIRMVFNARAMNRDDHLKNHAFLMDATGSWHLSPAYDVSFSLGPGGEHTLLIAGEGRRPGRTQFLDVAKSAGIKPHRASEIITGVDDAVSTWADHADAEEVPRVLRGEIARALAQCSTW
ncbi:MAG: type II toxin-antitoxin system HipA family toxin, partial [Albidovulum sp.]